MQILNNNTNTNFQGAFRFKPSAIKAKQEVPSLFTRGKQIFENVMEKDDMVIVLRDNYDKRVGNYIKENNVTGVEYYPTIDTKCGLDSEAPEGLVKLMKEKAAEVKVKLDDILSTIGGRRKAQKHKKSSKELIMDTVNTAADALRLNIEAPVVNWGKDCIRVRDNQKLRTLEIINKDGRIYVYVRPDSLNEDSIKCIIDGKGKIIKRFTTPTEISSFTRDFKNMKKQNINEY